MFFMLYCFRNSVMNFCSCENHWAPFSFVCNCAWHEMILQFQSSCCGVRLHVNAVFLFSVFPSLLSWPCSASGRQRRGLVRCTRLRQHAPGSGYVTCWQTSHSSLKGQSHQQYYICHIYLSEYRFGHWKGPQSINTQHAVLVHPDHFCISAAGVWLSGNCCCCASITKKALDHSLDHKWYKTWMQPPCYPLVSKIECFHHRHLVFWNGMWPTSGWIWPWKSKPVKVAS